MSETSKPAQVGSNEGLGLAPVAYLYHDARVPEDAHPWLHSTMLVLAADRRPGLRGETALVTLAQAEAMVAAERERCAKVCEERYPHGGYHPMLRSAAAYCAIAIREA